MEMNKIGLIIRREYLSRVKKKSFLIMTFVGPLLLAALYIVPILIAINSTTSTRTIAVVDESGWFAQHFTDNEEQIFIKVEGMSIDSVKRLVQDNIYDMALYIPATQLNIPSSGTLFSEKQIPLQIKNSITNTMKKEIESQKLLSYGIDPKVLESVKTNVALSTIKIDKDGFEKRTYSDVEYALGTGLSIIIYFFIAFFGGQVMQGVSEEKSSRIVEVLISSVRPFQLMAGKIIGVSLVALTQFALWIGLTSAIYFGFTASMGIGQHATITGTIMNEATETNNIMNNEMVMQAMEVIDSINFGVIITSFLAFFVLGYLLYATLYAAAGSLTESNTDSQQFTLPITTPLLLGFITSLQVVNNPDGALAMTLSMIPFTSPICMMTRIPFGIPIWQIIVSLIILIVSFIALTWIAAKIYRTGILMYGKKITYKEIAKWIKH